MFKPTLLAALSLGFLAAACAGPYDRQAPMPPAVSRAPSLSERTCLDYGFAAGSGAFDHCVQRESSARQAGRVSRGYAEARLLEDARNACSDYGLARGTQRYESCVTHEVDARRYRQQGQVSDPAQSHASGARAPAPYYQPRVATTGVEASRDEFGFRYDAEGNRLDASGRIISPQSTSR
jgi:hypothetical protein